MLTRETHLTIRIVQYLASLDDVQAGSNAMAIHAKLDIPGAVLRNILRRLTVAGIVRAKRGRAGGVNLEEKALKLSVMDVLNAVEPVKKHRKNSGCPTESCKNSDDPVCALFKKAQAKAQEVFENTTVGELVANPKK